MWHTLNNQRGGGSWSFVSLSVILHTLVLLALILLPSQLLQKIKLGHESQVEGEMELIGDIGTPGVDSLPAPTAAAPATATQTPEPAPAPAPAPTPAAPPAPAPVATKTLPAKKVRPAKAEPLVEEPVAVAIPQTEDTTTIDEANDEQLVAQHQEDAADNSNTGLEEQPAVTAPAESSSDLPAPTLQEPVARMGEMEAQQESASQTEGTATNEQVAAGSVSSGAGSASTGSGSGDTPNDARSYLELRQRTGNVPPTYPRIARKKGWQGEVILNYFVTAEGVIRDIKIEKSSGIPELDQEALRAVKLYRYIPGQEGWTSHPVVFALKGTAANQQ